MFIIKTALRVIFYAIIGFLGVLAVYTGCTRAKTDAKMLLELPGGVLFLAALGCCIAGLRIDAVFAALGCVFFFILGIFVEKADTVPFRRAAFVIRLIIYTVIVIVFALL